MTYPKNTLGGWLAYRDEIASHVKYLRKKGLKRDLAIMKDLYGNRWPEIFK